MVMKTKRNDNKEHNDVTKIFLVLPTYLLGFLAASCSYISQNVGLSVKLFNLKANAFGHVVLTNIGSIGLEEGFAPIPSPTHCSILACLGKVTKKAVVIEGDQIVVREMMKCVYTVDHRHGDAAILLQFIKIMKDYIEDPENFNADKYPQLPFYEDIAKERKAKAMLTKKD